MKKGRKGKREARHGLVAWKLSEGGVRERIPWRFFPIGTAVLKC